MYGLIETKADLKKIIQGEEVYVDVKYGPDYALVKITHKEAANIFDRARGDEYPVEFTEVVDYMGRYLVLRVEDPIY